MITDDTIKKEILSALEGILNYVQVVCPPDNWIPMRSKILRIGNDAIRNLTDQPTPRLRDERHKAL